MFYFKFFVCHLVDGEFSTAFFRYELVYHLDSQSSKCVWGEFVLI